MQGLAVEKRKERRLKNRHKESLTAKKVLYISCYGVKWPSRDPCNICPRHFLCVYIFMLSFGILWRHLSI